MASSTPPATKPKADRFDESPMGALMYVESIPKASYEQWRSEKERKCSPVKPATTLEDMDTPTKKRHDVGCISENFQSFVERLNMEGGMDGFPSFEEVQAAKQGTVPLSIDYTRDGLIWRSDVRVCFFKDHKTAPNWKNLVVHLPNDGFFYVAESLLPVLAVNKRNVLHLNTCSEGWAYLDKCLWPKLKPFEQFARDWFGYDETNKLQRQIMYNDASNRMDISLRCPKTKVGFDFVFEPGFPVPEVSDDFWF
jgi:hypothetical protein